jgi:hypothetical protein
LRVKHRGTNSPVAGREAHLLSAILQCAALHPPMQCVEGLTLANSLIDGTVAHIYRMAWKAMHLKTEQMATHSELLGGATGTFVVIGIWM